MAPYHYLQFWVHESAVKPLRMKTKGAMGGLEFVHFTYTQTMGRHSSNLVSPVLVLPTHGSTRLCVQSTKTQITHTTKPQCAAYYKGNGHLVMPGKHPRKKATDADRAHYHERQLAFSRHNKLLVQAGPDAWYCSDAANIIDNQHLISAICSEFDKGTIFDEAGTVTSPNGKGVVTLAQVAFGMFKVGSTMLPAWSLLLSMHATSLLACKLARQLASLPLPCLNACLLAGWKLEYGHWWCVTHMVVFQFRLSIVRATIHSQVHKRVQGWTHGLVEGQCTTDKVKYALVALPSFISPAITLFMTD